MPCQFCFHSTRSPEPDCSIERCLFANTNPALLFPYSKFSTLFILTFFNRAYPTRQAASSVIGNAHQISETSACPFLTNTEKIPASGNRITNCLNFRVNGLGGNIRFYPKYPKQQAHRIDHRAQKQTVSGDLRRLLGISRFKKCFQLHRDCFSNLPDIPARPPAGN